VDTVLTGVILGVASGLLLGVVVALRRRRRRRRGLGSSRLAVVEVDGRGAIRRTNAAFDELVGGGPMPDRLTDLVHPDDLAAFVAGVIGDLRLGNPVRGSCRLLRNDEGVRHVQLVADGGRGRHRRILVLDVSEDADHELRRRQGDSRSRIDPLTGLPNRAALAEHLTLALRDARRGTRPVVLLVDLEELDGLAPHEREVAVLEASRRLSGAARGLDHLSRFGDGQFVVVASGVADSDGALRAAERIGRALEGPSVVGDGVVVPLRASVGVAHPWPEDSAINVLRRAQDALARTRGAGATGESA
jgi:diguanylate cyclase (GGDEF)-like protein